MKPIRADFPDGPAGEAAYADALRHHKADEEVTPVMRQRSLSSSSITAWGVVQSWLATDQRRATSQRVTDAGLKVEAYDETDHVVFELVRPNEDPSTALVRAIGKLRV